MRYEFILRLGGDVRGPNGEEFGTKFVISSMERWDYAQVLTIVERELGGRGLWLFKSWLREKYPKEGAVLEPSKIPPLPGQPEYYMDHNYDFEEGYKRFQADQSKPKLEVVHG